MDGFTTIAEVIRTIRAALGLTQAELSERVGVTIPSIYRYESGKSLPQTTTLKALYDIAENLGHKEAVYILGSELARRFDSTLTPIEQSVEAPLMKKLVSAHPTMPPEFSNSPIAKTPESFIGTGDEMYLKLAERVRLMLLEAQACLKFSLFSSALYMSMYAIEITIGLALPKKDRHITDTKDGFKCLYGTAIIDRRLLDWGTEVIEIYNRAKTAMAEASAEDAQDVFKFAVRIWDYVCVLSSDIADFNKRRHPANPQRS